MPNSKVEFCTLHVSLECICLFLPNCLRFFCFTCRNPDLPRITMSHQRQTPSNSVLTVRDWFQRVLTKEVTYLPRNSMLTFTEWNIVTGNLDLFNICGNIYDRLVLVFGEEKIHWVYYRNMPYHQRLEGSETLCISFCSCCLQNQYKRVVATIIKFMSEHYPPQVLAGNV